MAPLPPVHRAQGCNKGLLLAFPALAHCLTGAGHALPFLVVSYSQWPGQYRKNKINTYCLPSTALAVLARKVALSPSLSCSVSHSGLMAPNGQLSFCWSWQGVICPIPWSCRILIWSRCKNPSFKGLLTLAIHNLPIGRVGLETTSINRPVGA